MNQRWNNDSIHDANGNHQHQQNYDFDDERDRLSPSRHGSEVQLEETLEDMHHQQRPQGFALATSASQDNSEFDLEPTPIRPGGMIKVIHQPPLQHLVQRLQAPQRLHHINQPEHDPRRQLQQYHPAEPHHLPDFTSLRQQSHNQNNLLVARTAQQSGTTTTLVGVASTQAFLSSHLHYQLSQSSQTAPLRAPNFASLPAAIQQEESQETQFPASFQPFKTPPPQSSPAFSQTQQAESGSDHGQRKEPPSLVFLGPNEGPGENDIVCARGRRFYNMPGSIRFREILNDFIPAYLGASSRVEKSSVIAKVIHHVQTKERLRFLKFHSGSNVFSIMELPDVRDKIGHALRTAIKDLNEGQRSAPSPDNVDADSF